MCRHDLASIPTAIHPHHEPVAAPGASVLCVETEFGGIDDPDIHSRGSAPGAHRFFTIEPAAASEALVGGIYLQAGGNGILDVASTPAKGAENARIGHVIIRRACGPRPPIRSAHTATHPALHEVVII